MNEALKRWREDFAQEPTTAFDRLVRGIVPLGVAGQLSLGEIFDDLFAPGDAALDAAAATWLERHLLGPVPERMTLQRWTAVLEGYFRGIATMELPKTGELLRKQSKRIRLWLHSLYEGPDRDPEGAYLMALARAQVDQSLSPLWRRLILAEELAERHHLDIGILGFRKMPGQNGDVPEGLLQALVKLGDKQGTSQARWKQTMRSLFAAYRRTEGYWVEHLAPLLPHYHEPSHARDWLTALLPGISRWRPPPTEMPGASLRRAQPVPRGMSLDWVDSIRSDPALCDTPAFAAFLNQHRAYAETTGDPEYITKTFNNLATKLIRADRSRADFAVSLMEEALDWAPRNPRTWTIYAQTLWAAHRREEAIQALWQARHRFAWESFARTELGRILRESGDLAASAGVLREAVSHFPHNAVCRTGLAQTLLVMGQLEEARQVYAEACEDFPDNDFCRNGLAQTLLAMGWLEEAHQVYAQACKDFPDNAVCRTGLAQTLLAMGRLEEARQVYAQTCEDYPDDDICRTGLAQTLLAMGRLEEAHQVYAQACKDFPDNDFCRNGLAHTLRMMGRLEEARRVYVQACKDFPDTAVCRTGLANLLIDLNEVKEAEQLFRDALAIDANDQYAKEGLARVLSMQDTKPLDEARHAEAKSLLMELAQKRDSNAWHNLPVFDDQWQQITTDTTVHAQQEPEQQQPAEEKQQPAEQKQQPAEQKQPAEEKQQPTEPQKKRGSGAPGMSNAERLGRAMIALWQAERTEDAGQRASLCTDATALLDVPEMEVEAELLAAFLETRGLILLASGDAQKALVYFEEQAKHFGRGGWIGIQIGGERARIVLGLPEDTDASIEAPSSQSARFALHVARVLQMLSSGLLEAEVRELLKTLYPEATRFASRSEPDARGELHIENGAEMLGVYLRTRWFQPAGIDSVEDLDQPNRLDALQEQIQHTRTDTFDVLTNATLSLAA